MNEKVGQKVWKIQINKVINAKSDLYKNGITIENYEIIGISKHKICINTNYFDTFYYLSEKGEKKCTYGRYLNEIEITIKTKEDYFGNGIFSNLYSTKKPSKAILNKIVREISLKIDKEYGFLFGEIKNELNGFVNNYNIK